MNYFCHEKAIVETKNIGKDSKVWAFAHILPNARIGENANICDHVFIENDVIIGDNVTVKCGVQIWDGVRIENNVFVGPNVTFTNDPFPRSKDFLKEYPKTIIEYGSSLGANSTILPGLTVSYGAMIGAGTVLTKNAPPFSTIVGNPGVVIKYQYDSVSTKHTFKESYIEFTEEYKTFNLIELTLKNYDYCYSNSKSLLFTKHNVDVVVDNGNTRILHKLNSQNNYLEISKNCWVSILSKESNASICKFTQKSEAEAAPIHSYKSFKKL